MIDPSQVSAVLVTRGDVDMSPIVNTLPVGMEVVMWDNSVREDFGVFGRYMGCLEATRPVVYVQDDDCLVRNIPELLASYRPGWVVGNRKNDVARARYYEGTTLLGWGAVFDRELPWRAFARYALRFPIDREFMFGLGAETAFPMLTPSRQILVDEIDWLEQDGAAVFARENRMSNADGFYDRHAEAMGRAREVLRDMLGVAA